jgi:hypothetical protein
MEWFLLPTHIGACGEMSQYRLETNERKRIAGELQGWIAGAVLLFTQSVVPKIH